MLEERSGFVSVMLQGTNVSSIFQNESGGHRWQRKPPNEKRGRIHTSTVTVAVLDPFIVEKSLNMSDVSIQTTKGSGPGGQNRNKVETCVVMTHIPTGTTVRVDGRSQHQNKQAALKLLATRVFQSNLDQANSKRDSVRKEQVGSGMRGDKIRTYRVQDDQVIDHRSDQKWRLRDWIRGEW